MALSILRVPKVPTSEFLQPQGCRSIPNTSMALQMQARANRAQVTAQNQRGGQLASPNTSAASGCCCCAWPVSRLCLTHLGHQRTTAKFSVPKHFFDKESAFVFPQSVCFLGVTTFSTLTSTHSLAHLHSPSCGGLHADHSPAFDNSEEKKKTQHWAQLLRPGNMSHSPQKSFPSSPPAIPTLSP